MLDHLKAPDRVLAEEPARALAVGSDATHHGRRVKQDFRARAGEEALDVGGHRQFVVRQAWNEYLAAAAGLERLASSDISASTISPTSSSNPTRCRHPSRSRALDGSA